MHAQRRTAKHSGWNAPAAGVSLKVMLMSSRYDTSGISTLHHRLQRAREQQRAQGLAIGVALLHSTL